MFPNVNGFHWTFGHILFLSIFAAVLVTIAGTVLFAILRSARDLRRKRVDAIRWHVEFEDLPRAQRRCRHELCDQVTERECERGFDCRSCKDHAAFAALPEWNETEICGLPYSPQRLYHRGHTWVEPQADGTVLVGLDEIASRIVGQPDRVELPARGSEVTANGPGWRMSKNGYEVRILAPVDGEVVEGGSPEDGFYLRVKPKTQDFRHLLRGSELKGWVARELERLQMAFAPAASAASLADGGELVHDLVSKVPEAKWDAVLGEIFLEP